MAKSHGCHGKASEAGQGKQKGGLSVALEETPCSNPKRFHSIRVQSRLSTLDPDREGPSPVISGIEPFPIPQRNVRHENEAKTWLFFGHGFSP